MKLFSRSAVLSALFFAGLGQADSRIINGVEVPAGAFPEVIQVNADAAHCTATLVGPRVVLTAAHCAKNGASLQFKVGEKSYAAKVYRHPDFPSQDRDVALAIVNRAVEGVRPMRLGTGVQPGNPIFLLGYGCTEPGGGGGNDGKLRIGETSVSGFSDADFITKKEDGAAVCFGDSGGPSYRYADGKYEVVGVNSKGNIIDTNYSANLGLDSTQRFFREVAKKENVEICGVTSGCEDPIALAPKFESKVTNIALKAGTAYTTELESFMESVTDDVVWSLDPEAPKWIAIDKELITFVLPIDATGTYHLSLTAKNSAGADATLLRISVLGLPVPAPTCALTAKPAFVKLGESVTVSIKTQGEATSAKIEGHELYPDGAVTFVTTAVGVFTVKGQVEGPGGQGICLTRYAVK